jgi:hypothetical protein
MQSSGVNTRQYWVETLTTIAKPVLTALAERRLKASMPVGGVGDREERREFTHLEALGRTLNGMAPWLEHQQLGADEEKLRRENAVLARQAIEAATDPASPDFVNFNRGHQPIVDAAFLAQALLRAPNELWFKLDRRAQTNLIDGLMATRSRKPFFCNWLLFAALIEAFFCKVGVSWDRMRVDYALKQHEQWYLGDGVYGDGPEFHWDYYNSLVIHPMLLDLLEVVGATDPEWEQLQPRVWRRAVRHAEVLERLIAPDGSFPPLGRSLTYRFGVFHLLAQMALKRSLPRQLHPSQVRSALTAVIERVIKAPGTFDASGWLQIGFCGNQNNLGERYISTGSLYLCTTVFLPLGLDSQDDFWSGRPRDWTAKQIWSGRNIGCDRALNRESM